VLETHIGQKRQFSVPVPNYQQQIKARHSKSTSKSIKSVRELKYTMALLSVVLKVSCEFFLYEVTFFSVNA